MSKVDEIKRVLMEYRVTGSVKIEPFYGHAIIMVNDEYFGRYDFERHTFVD